MIYQFKLGPKQYPVEAQVVGEQLEALRIRNNGHLTPRAIVDGAAPESSPLHPLFEWDDRRAAKSYREHQAQEVLRMIVVRIPEQPIDADPVRAFVSVRIETEPVYTSIGTALGDDAMREQLLAQAMRDLVAIRTRYKDLQELAALFAQMLAAGRARRFEALTRRLARLSAEERRTLDEAAALIERIARTG